MSFKVVRDIAGDVVAFGPNDGNYEPCLSDGRTLSIEADDPALTPNAKLLAASQISTLEAKTLLPRVVRECLLAEFEDKADKAGLDPTLLPAYVKLKALDEQIAELRAQL